MSGYSYVRSVVVIPTNNLLLAISDLISAIPRLVKRNDSKVKWQINDKDFLAWMNSLA